jgi:hypothetical protein
VRRPAQPAAEGSSEDLGDSSYAPEPMSDGVGRLKRLEEFTLSDLEAVALMLRGESVIDWHRLHVTTPETIPRIARGWST